MDENQNDNAKLLARLGALQTNAIIQNMNPYVIQQRKNTDCMRQNCPFVEWEQDMSRTIPFCGKSGDFCNGQCIPREY